MTFRELLSKFSLDELWYYLSMRHGIQCKPVKARKMRESYDSARSELLALELNQGETCGELFCDLYTDKTDEWSDTFFSVLLKEAEETSNIPSGIDFMPWKDIIDLPVSQASLDHYGELLCTAEILWEFTFHGYSADSVASESDLLYEAIEEVKSENTERKLLDLDVDEYGINPPEFDDKADVKATLDWFANAPDCVKRSVRNCISIDVLRDEDNEQLAAAKALEKLKKIVDSEPNPEDIIELPWAMTRELDIDNMLLLLRALDGALYPLSL
jgi:hypothetical protein